MSERRGYQTETEEPQAPAALVNPKELEGMSIPEIMAMLQARMATATPEELRATSELGAEVVKVSKTALKAAAKVSVDKFAVLDARILAAIASVETADLAEVLGEDLHASYRLVYVPAVEAVEADEDVAAVEASAATWQVKRSGAKGASSATGGTREVKGEGLGRGEKIVVALTDEAQAKYGTIATIGSKWPTGSALTKALDIDLKGNSSTRALSMAGITLGLAS